MITANKLVSKLAALTSKGGNCNILLQADGEGNSYEYAEGAELTYVSKDLEHTYDSLEEALENGEEDPTLVIVIYP
jgi:hypothetical protein